MIGSVNVQLRPLSGGSRRKRGLGDLPVLGMCDNFTIQFSMPSGVSDLFNLGAAVQNAFPSNLFADVTQGLPSFGVGSVTATYIGSSPYPLPEAIMNPSDSLNPWLVTSAVINGTSTSGACAGVTPPPVYVKPKVPKVLLPAPKKSVPGSSSNTALFVAGGVAAVGAAALAYWKWGPK
jgi:hypothetical protein